MTYKKLAKGVKELRKRKGLSQEDLAKNSGLSLRTIQRVENGETEPSGETLRRISAVLDVTTNKLMDWDTNQELLKHSVKTKNEYLHVFDSKLIISTSPEINNLVEDYRKSVNNVFKTIMLFLIFIPIFTILAVIFYNMGKPELLLQAGGFAFLFLTVAFYSILFTSGSSLIKMEHIYKIQIQKSTFHNAVVIYHKESSRLKTRALILEKDQVDTMKDILFSEKLIEEKDIKLKRNTRFYILVSFIAVIVLFSIIPRSLTYNTNINLKISVFIPILFSAFMIVKMILQLKKPSFKNKKLLPAQN